MVMKIKPYVLKESASKVIDWGSKIAGPEQRLIAGVAALTSQPFIDYYNKDVDEQTRKYSVARTLVKIIVGTTVGVAVRKYSIKMAKNFFNKGVIKPIKSLKTPVERAEFVSTLGDTLGLITCFFTNFIIDAPLTKYGMNYLTHKFSLQNPENENEKKET